MKLLDVRDKILNGPNDNFDRLIEQKKKQEQAGIPCTVVYLDDIQSWAVIRVEKQEVTA